MNLSLILLAAALAVVLCVKIMARRAVARFVAAQFVEYQNQRAAVCIHGKKRVECWDCVDAPAEATAASFSSSAPHAALTASGPLVMKFDQPFSDLELHLHVNSGWVPSASSICVEDTYGRMFSMHSLMEEANAVHVTAFHFGVRKIFIREIKWIDHLELRHRGMIIVDGDPASIRALHGMLS